MDKETEGIVDLDILKPPKKIIKLGGVKKKSEMRILKSMLNLWCTILSMAERSTYQSQILYISDGI